MLQRLDRSDVSLGDLGDDLEGEVGNEAEGDHLALVVGQERQGGDQLGIEGIGRRRSRGVRQLSVEHLGAPSPTAGVVDDTVPGDGEDPTPQVVAIAAEPTEVASYLEKDLAEQILGIAGALRPQVAQHGRGKVAIDVLRIVADVSSSASRERE
jgi:hypothetical protein